MSLNVQGTPNKFEPAYTDTDKMPFGKFADTPMQDVPPSYLAYLWQNGLKLYRGDTNPDDPKRCQRVRVCHYIWNSRHAINQELNRTEIV